ncbi:hypothetical protein J6TS2_01820 [Heyndrickxia sporothermodurans]|nr:hypothetical protein J6TS2_01820 [Heyndrickxia sporothermodurans]
MIVNEQLDTHQRLQIFNSVPLVEMGKLRGEIMKMNVSGGIFILSFKKGV